MSYSKGEGYRVGYKKGYHDGIEDMLRTIQLFGLATVLKERQRRAEAARSTKQVPPPCAAKP